MTMTTTPKQIAELRKLLAKDAAGWTTYGEAHAWRLTRAVLPSLLADLEALREALETLDREVEMLEMFGETGTTASRSNVETAQLAARAALADGGVLTITEPHCDILAERKI